MRRTALPVLLLPLLAALLAPSPSPAVAQVETCQGQPATHVWVGEGGTATDGNDVIVARVSGTYVRINGLGGDDLICVSGNLPIKAYVRIEAGTGHDSVEVRFGDEANSAEVWEAEVVDIDLGGGLDKLMFGSQGGGGTIDGGADSARLYTRAIKSTYVDLAAGTLGIDDGEFSLTHFRRASSWGPRIVMTGDGRRNMLRARGCRVTLRGGGGADIMSVHSDTSQCPDTRTARLLGQEGDDRLTGSGFRDVLIGGPGRDSANGMRGKDRCVAEKKTSCER